MKEYRSSKLILIFFFLFIVTSPLLFMGKGSIMLVVNNNNSQFLDISFLWISKLGNTFTAFIIFIGLLFTSNLRWSYQFFVSFLIQLITVLILKHWLFDHTYRPYFFYDKNAQNLLHVVQGVKLYSFDSFPSGHTTTAFFIAIFFILKLKNNYISIPLILAATLVGISRMYLAQHFFIDVYFGALFGSIAAIVGHLITIKKHKTWYPYKIGLYKGRLKRI